MTKVAPGGTADAGQLYEPVAGKAADGKHYPLAVGADGRLVSGAGAATATLTNVNDTASSTTLLAANADRKGAIIVNDSTSILYLKYGATASATSFSYKLNAGATWEMPQPPYTGIIDGISSADASGAARITEVV